MIYIERTIGQEFVVMGLLFLGCMAFMFGALPDLTYAAANTETMAVLDGWLDTAAGWFL